MSAARLAIRRPTGSRVIPQQLLRALRHKLLPLPVALRLSLHQLQTESHALSALQECQCQRRFQSTTSNSQKPNSDGKDGRNAKSPPPPRQTLTRVLIRALWASFRSLGAPFRGGTLRKLYRDHPEDLVVALAMYAIDGAHDYMATVLTLQLVS